MSFFVTDIFHSNDDYFWETVLGFKLRVSYLLGKHSTTWGTLPFSFALVYFSDGVWCFFPGPASDHDTSTSISQIVHIRGMHHYTQIIYFWDKILLISSLLLALSCNPYIFTSQVVGITDMHHHIWLDICIFIYSIHVYISKYAYINIFVYIYIYEPKSMYVCVYINI
jgi:hypothetical protein